MTMDKKDEVHLYIERNSNKVDMEIEYMPDDFKDVEISKEEMLILLESLENFDEYVEGE